MKQEGQIDEAMLEHLIPAFYGHVRAAAIALQAKAARIAESLQLALFSAWATPAAGRPD